MDIGSPVASANRDIHKSCAVGVVVGCAVVMKAVVVHGKVGPTAYHGSLAFDR